MSSSAESMGRDRNRPEHLNAGSNSTNPRARWLAGLGTAALRLDHMAWHAAEACLWLACRGRGS